VSIVSEFREFISRGNVIDLAVGVIHPRHVGHRHAHHRVAMSLARRLGRRGGHRAGKEADHGQKGEQEAHCPRG